MLSERLKCLDTAGSLNITPPGISSGSPPLSIAMAAQRSAAAAATAQTTIASTRPAVRSAPSMAGTYRRRRRVRPGQAASKREQELRYLSKARGATPMTLHEDGSIAMSNGGAAPWVLDSGRDALSVVASQDERVSSSPPARSSWGGFFRRRLGRTFL